MYDHKKFHLLCIIHVMYDHKNCFYCIIHVMYAHEYCLHCIIRVMYDQKKFLDHFDIHQKFHFHCVIDVTCAQKKFYFYCIDYLSYIC